MTDYVAIFPLAAGKLRAKFEAKLEKIKLPPTTVKVTDLVILLVCITQSWLFGANSHSW